jgi:type II secretory ATPase GspE/PulE/Tfp pilus assembly ATPase PilB-like protein
MSDFPSIGRLLQKTPATGKQPAVLSAADDVPSKLNNKIEKITISEKEKETQQLAQASGLPYIELSQFPVTAEALRALPEDIARAQKLICFYFDSEEIRFGCVEPTDEILELIYQAGERHHAHTKLYIISEQSWKRVIALYANLPIVKPISKDINITDEELERFQNNIDDLKSLHDQFAQVPITDVLTLLIAAALKSNASDVHVEAEEKGVAVRYRVDGILHEVANLPREQWKNFVSRIKLLAALKINITDKPQDGRVSLKLSKDSLDIRVSTLPTAWGESVVMRILYSGSAGITFDQLGLRGSAYEHLKREVTRPNGMIITTGPTGSGKTTTMYAILRTLNQPGVKIITLEDPIEIKMEGINQSQVDPTKDYTFSKGLRSILRQDPDICLVGEIRDLDSAEIAIQAALTGHLLLSTIHTNSASGAIPRFLSMGVKPFLLAPALNAVIGQRLVRKICEHCKVKDELNAEKLERINKILSTLPAEETKNVDLNHLQFYRGAGCKACSGLGYKGRVGIYEIFTMNKEIETVILSQSISEYTIEEIVEKNGMVTMVQDGLLKALDQVTTVEEVFRVTE